MKGIIEIGFNPQDQPVLKFTHGQDSSTLEQQLLGALVRKIAKQGIELQLVKTYPDQAGKIFWDYEIRAKQPDNETD